MVVGHLRGMATEPCCQEGVLAGQGEQMVLKRLTQTHDVEPQRLAVSIGYLMPVEKRLNAAGESVLSQPAHFPGVFPG